MVREALTPETLSGLAADEAAARFVARQAEGLTEHERGMLTAWLESAASNQRAFENAERAWRVFGAADGHEVLAAMRAHALAPRRRAWSVWRQAAAVAAVLVVVVGAGLAFRSGIPGLSPAPSSSPTLAGPEAGASLQYASARGEVKEVALPDGSAMTLDADSLAIGRFAPGGRSVELKRGRAFFAVAHDPSRPFAVTAAGRRIVAMGTRFDVDLAGEVLTVALLDGRVTVASVGGAATPITLEPGQQLVARGASVTVRAMGVKAQDAISWRRGLINFDDQPLAQAVAVMNRYGGEEVVINDPAIAAIRVTGQFRAGDGGRFAQTVAELYRLKVERKENGVELVSRAERSQARVRARPGRDGNVDF